MDLVVCVGQALLLWNSASYFSDHKNLVTYLDDESRILPMILSLVFLILANITSQETLSSKQTVYETIYFYAQIVNIVVLISIIFVSHYYLKQEVSKKKTLFSCFSNTFLQMSKGSQYK